MTLNQILSRAIQGLAVLLVCLLGVFLYIVFTGVADAFVEAGKAFGPDGIAEIMGGK